MFSFIITNTKGFHLKVGFLKPFFNDLVQWYHIIHKVTLLNEKCRSIYIYGIFSLFLKRGCRAVCNTDVFEVVAEVSFMHFSCVTLLSM